MAENTQVIIPQSPISKRTAEQFRRLHRCCFIGAKGESRSEAETRKNINALVQSAVADGFTTFITGMSCGFETWAGEAVIRLRKENPNIHLIAAVPFPGFEGRWTANMQMEFHELLRSADFIQFIAPGYSVEAYHRRDEWMIDRSSRIITPTDSGKSIDYARMLEVPVVTLRVA